MMRCEASVYWLLFWAVLSFGASCNDVSISTQSDADDIKSCSTISGDVTISSSYSGALKISGVRKITGNLTSTGATSLTSLSAPDLGSIGSNLTIISATLLSTLNFGSLTSVGTLNLKALPLLRSASFDSSGITTVGDVEIVNCALTNIDWLNVKIAGQLEITDNTELETLSLSSLQNYTGPLTVAGNGENLSLDLPSVTQGGKTSVFNVTKVGMGAMETLTGALKMQGNTFVTFAVPKLVKAGNVDISENTNLGTVHMPKLQSLRGLIITDDQNMTSVSFPALSFVGGDVTFSGITQVSMPNIAEIMGTYSISGSNLDCGALKNTNYADASTQFECILTKSTGGDDSSTTTATAVLVTHTGITSPSSTTSSSSASESASVGSNNSGDTSGLSSGAKAGIGVGVGVGVPAIIGFVLFFIYRRRHQKKREQDIRSENDGSASPVEVDGGSARVEAPGTKSEMTAELGTDGKNKEPAELE